MKMRTGRSVVALALAAFAAAAGHAAAQDAPARLLRGIGSVDVVIEKVDTDGVRCGVQSTSLESALRTALHLSPIRQELDAGPYMYLRGLFVASDTQCLYTLSLELRSPVAVDETGNQGIASIWRTGYIEATGIGQAPKRIRGAVESLAEEFVSDWTRANR